MEHLWILSLIGVVVLLPVYGVLSWWLMQYGFTKRGMTVTMFIGLLLGVCVGSVLRHFDWILR